MIKDWIIISENVCKLWSTLHGEGTDNVMFIWGAIVTCSFLCVCASYKSHWIFRDENLLKNY